MIKGIPEGTYTLSELIAPDGYKINSDAINFRIDNEGKLLDEESNYISRLIVYHEKNKKVKE